MFASSFSLPSHPLLAGAVSGPSPLQPMPTSPLLPVLAQHPQTGAAAVTGPISTGRSVLGREVFFAI